jgi:hypothetical protein
LKAVLTDHLPTQHELLAVYYDVRDAYRLVLKASLAVQENDPFYGTWVTYCAVDDVAKLYGMHMNPCAEFKVIVAGSDMSLVPDILATCGGLQCLRQISYSHRSVFTGQYFDERSTIKAIQELHSVVVQVRLQKKLCF